MTIKEALHLALKFVEKSNRTLSNFDIELILSYVAKKTREYLFTHPESKLDKLQSAKFLKMVKQRIKGWPLAYLIGSQEFYGLDFKVTKDVLIPRPETELIIDKTQEIIQKNFSNNFTVADIGTGSGAIAITLAKKNPKTLVYATDKSRKALLIAKYNAKKNIVRIKFHHGDLISPLQNKKIDILVANLPYLPTSYTHPTIKHEPKTALYSGPDGLQAYRRLIKSLSKEKTLPSFIILEIGLNQYSVLNNYIKKIYPEATVDLYKDLAGLDRLIVWSN